MWTCWCLFLAKYPECEWCPQERMALGTESDVVAEEVVVAHNHVGVMAFRLLAARKAAMKHS